MIEKELRRAIRDQVENELADGIPVFTVEDSFAGAPPADLVVRAERVEHRPARRVAAAAVVVGVTAVGAATALGLGDSRDDPNVTPPPAAATTAVSGPTPEANGPMVPIVTGANGPHGASPSWQDGRLYDALSLLVAENPSTLTYLTTDAAGELVIGATDLDAARRVVDDSFDALATPAADRARVHLTAASLSHADLVAMVDDISDDPEFHEFGARLISINAPEERVVVNMLSAPDEYRRDLYARFGDAVAIQITTHTPELASPEQTG